MSKANQKFVQADEAVSPVIGVILMVAITVVLAAVVFVLVSNLGEGSEGAPNVSFNKDSSAGTLTVVRADSGQTWDDFTATGCDTVTDDLEFQAGNETTAAAYDPALTYAVQAGDTFSGCEAGETFRLTHEATNTLVYSTTF